VEFTKDGHFVREYKVDASQGGAFGFDTRLTSGASFNFAVIDDVINRLAVYHLPVRKNGRTDRGSCIAKVCSAAAAASCTAEAGFDSPAPLPQAATAGSLRP
jgi:hypothetical protein